MRTVRIAALGALLAACGSASPSPFAPEPPLDAPALDAGPKDPDVVRFDVARDASACPGQGSELSGVVLSPNGEDPVFGAVVYALAGDPPPIEAGVACDACRFPPGVLAFATTGVDGRFALPHVRDGGGPVTLVLQKGRFRRVLRPSLGPCAPMALPPAQTRLPGAAGRDATLPRILVATGVNDDIGSVLTRMGIAEFERVDGCRSAGSTAAVGACPFGQVLGDRARLLRYNVVLAPCGALGNFRAWQYLPRAHADNLRAFLQAGGRLYASDLSYGILERTFPEAMAFAGGETLSSGGNDPANVGHGGSRAMPLSYDGIIDDPDLRAWMNARGALLPDGRVRLTEFINPWAAVDTAGPGARVLVHGPVRWRDARGTLLAPADHPLTVAVDYRGDGRGCGRVVFTSYHTTSRATGPLTPQERVLAWLLFELGGCVTVG